MRIKQGVLLILFSSLFMWTISAQQADAVLSLHDAYGGNQGLYEGYFGIHLGAPVVVTNPKELTEVPPVEKGSKVYNVLTFLLRDRGIASKVSVNDANLLLNSERDYGESVVDFRSRIPYGAWTSVHQYFLDQSNGKFNVFFTVLEFDADDFLADGETSLSELSLMIRATEHAKSVFGDLRTYFDGLNYIFTTSGTGRSAGHGAGVSFIGASDYKFPLPLQYHFAPERIVLRELCVATAYNLCNFPPLYKSPDFDGSRLFDIDELAANNPDGVNIAGFCLMGGLVPSVANNVRFEGHPPSINPYYKWKVGWIDNIEMDQDTKKRAGVQHEGRLTYTYEPHDEKEFETRTKDEFFMLETRQNRNYEAGTIKDDGVQTRGIIDEDKLGDPKDSVNPAEGLVVYHVKEKRVGNSLFFIGVVDSTWEEPDTTEEFYPNAAPARAPWRLEKDAAFRDQEQLLVEVGAGNGAYSWDGAPNPPGGCDIAGEFRSVKRAFEEAGKDFEVSLSKLTQAGNGRLHYEEYIELVENGAVITQYGQYDSEGNYSPSGEYVFQSNQNNVGDRVDEEFKANKAELMLAPDGNGYFDKDGNFKPGGGYEPAYEKDLYGDPVIDEVTGNAVILFQVKKGGDFRQLFDAGGNETSVVQDFGGSFGKDLLYKDIVNRNTFPSLEFFTYTMLFSDGTTFTSIFRNWVNQYLFEDSEIDFLAPSFSNISPVDQTMTTEVCNNTYYYKGSHGMDEVNGFLQKRYENDLGVAAKEDTLTLKILQDDETVDNADALYNSYLNEMYKRYTFDMNLNYLDLPEDLRIGIWNRGGQDLEYEVVNDGGVLSELVNIDDATGTMVDRAKTLRFKFDFETFARTQVGKPFPWTTKFRFARILWQKKFRESDSGDNAGRKYQTDLYINLRIKSPAKVIAAASVEDFSVFRDADLDPVNVPGVNGLLEFSIPVYAQQGVGNMWIINAGETALRQWALADADWFAAPPTNPDDRVVQWIGGNAIGNYQVKLKVPELVAAGALGHTLRGSVEVFSDNRDVNTGQKVNVRVDVDEVLPPAPAFYRLLDEADRNQAFLDVDLAEDNSYINDALVSGSKDIEVFSDRVYQAWPLVKDVTHYVVYRSTEKKALPDSEDLYRIIHVGDYGSNTSFTVPESDKTYYTWIRSVGVNDPSVENLITDTYDIFVNDDLDKHLSWLNEMTPANESNRIASLMRFAGGSQVALANKLSDRVFVKNSYETYFSALLTLMEVKKIVTSAAPFELLDMFELNRSFPNDIRLITDEYLEFWPEFEQGLNDLKSLAAKLGNEDMKDEDAVVNIDESNLVLLATQNVAELNKLFGTSFGSYSEMAAMAGMDVAQVAANLVVEINGLVAATLDGLVEGKIADVTHTLNAYHDSGVARTWRNRLGSTIFLGDRYSNRTSATRSHVGPPATVVATTNREDNIVVAWSFITPRVSTDAYLFDRDSFQVWRSKERDFSTAMQIDDPEIKIISDEPTSQSPLTFSSILFFGSVDNLYTVGFSFTDETPDPYPESYYYWILTQDDNGMVSEPSLPAYGRRAKDTGELLPIVDNEDDDDANLFVDDFVGSVELAQRSENSDDMAWQLSAHNNSRSGSVAGSARYDAAIIKFLDLTGIDKGDIVMSFDYRFEDPTGKGYVTAVVDGKEVFVAYADKAGDEWQKTGYIDLSAFAGKDVKLEIGLVCDIDNPSQVLWLDNLYVAGKRFSPCWELISVPAVAKLSDSLTASYSEDSTLYSWSNSLNDYVKHAAKELSLDGGEGYWIYLSEPLKKGELKLPVNRPGSYQSKLRNLPIGWSLCGPVKDVILKDSRSVSAPDSSADYLNIYPNICSLEDVMENGQAVQRFSLKASVWTWDSNIGKYRQVIDRLQAGKAYWIFNY